MLLGVVDAQFPARTYSLKPGDKLLLYSDGVDNAVIDGHAPGAESLIACANRHRESPVGTFVEQVARDLFGGAAQPDDLTLLGVEMTG